jgi:flagellar basal-body rod protein FlgC
MFLQSMNITGSALTAQKLRMEIISSNIANASTTRTESGKSYRRKMVVFTPVGGNNSFEAILGTLKENGNVNGNGVKVSAIIEDQSPLKPVYNPSHPDADENGYVMMPNVDTVEEMVDMMSATRSYEANITALNAIKLMATKALEIGR